MSAFRPSIAIADSDLMEAITLGTFPDLNTGQWVHDLCGKGRLVRMQDGTYSIVWKRESEAFKAYTRRFQSVVRAVGARKPVARRPQPLPWLDVPVQLAFPEAIYPDQHEGDSQGAAAESWQVAVLKKQAAWSWVKAEGGPTPAMQHRYWVTHWAKKMARWGYRFDRNPTRGLPL